MDTCQNFSQHPLFHNKAFIDSSYIMKHSKILTIQVANCAKRNICFSNYAILKTNSNNTRILK